MKKSPFPQNYYLLTFFRTKIFNKHAETSLCLFHFKVSYLTLFFPTPLPNTATADTLLQKSLKSASSTGCKFDFSWNDRMSYTQATQNLLPWLDCNLLLTDCLNYCLHSTSAAASFEVPGIFMSTPNHRFQT